MRKLSEKRRHYLDKKSRLPSIINKKTKRPFKTQKDINTNKKIKGESIYQPLVAPPSITIENEDDRHKLLFFLDKVEYYTNRQIPIKIDFRKTRFFVVTGAILMLHSFYKIKKEGGLQYIELILPQENSLQDQVLYQIGFYELFNIARTVTTCSKNVVHWRVCQGNLVESKNYATMMEEEMSKLNISNNEISRLINGLNEAVTNSVRHAYDTRIFTKNCNYGWLVFFQFKDDTFYVAMSDIGAGIRETMNIPEGAWFQKLIKLGVQKKYSLPENDSDCIAMAANIASRSKKPERGKGIPEIVKTISGINDATVVIYSNKGTYMLKSKWDCHRLKEYSRSINGTIIYLAAPSASKNIQEK